MERTAFRYSKELTTTAIAIFGKIVDKAFFIAWDIDSDSEDVKTRLSEESSIVSDNEIDIGATTIWIQFITGNIVEIQSSEWGTIKCANTNRSYEI